MSNGFSVVAALVIAALLGGSFSAYLWLVRRKQAEARAGVEALSSMRWREFSRLVIEALRPRGFEAGSVEDQLEHGHQANLRLRRGGQTWLLACKQGEHYRISAPVVTELANAIGFDAADGGILVTPGRIEAEARKVPANIELFDGAALWTLVKPLLPASLLDDLTANSRTRTTRDTGVAWAAALVLGLLAGWLLAPGTASTPAAIAPVVAAVQPIAGDPPRAIAQAAPAPKDAMTTAPTDPNQEPFERNQVIHAVSELPGIDRALWSTRSTLLVYFADDSGAERINEICAVLNNHDNLRASRLQLQPAAGSSLAVRFLQCRAY